MLKKLLLKISLLILITVIPLITINYVVDPLQCFRKAGWYKPLYDPNERVQSGCLARSQVYDTVIAGSSHVENIDSADVDRMFGVSSVRLTIAASTLHEQHSVLNLALGTHYVKNVIWGLDTNILHDEPNRVRDDIVPFPEYIYQPGLYNNLLFLLDPYQIKHYAKMAINSFTGNFSEFENLRSLNSWSKMFTFSKERVLSAFDAVKRGEMLAMQNTNENLTVGGLNGLSTDNIDNNVLDLVKNNPSTHFIIYFPPYSIVRFIELYQDDREKLEAEWELKNYLASQLVTFKNVSLFDFQTTKEITHNLDNYKDLTHYSGAVDDYIIRSLRDKKNILNEQNYASSSLIIMDQINKFKF